MSDDQAEPGLPAVTSARRRPTLPPYVMRYVVPVALWSGVVFAAVTSES